MKGIGIAVGVRDGRGERIRTSGLYVPNAYSLVITYPRVGG